MTDTSPASPASPALAASRLVSPVRLGPVTLRNRLVASPVSINMATADGAVTPDIIDFYRTLGDAGTGLVTIGATAVSPEGGSTGNGMHIGPPALTPGLTDLARAVKATGAAVSLQVFHVGAQGNTAYSGQPVVGPSPYVCPDIGIQARELDIGEIGRIEDDFVAAVRIALDAGFDFVELHVAHGYLLHQFLSPFFNRRADAYGGSPDNRLRIFRRILEKLAAVEPAALPRLGARISGHDFQPDGLTVEANRPLVALMDAHGVAYWVVSAGVYETARQKYVHMRQGDYWRYAGQLRQITATPVVAQGGVRRLDQAEAILAAGQGDLVGMAQALIADPRLVHKTLAGRADTVAECIGCRRCRYLRRHDLTFDCLLPEGYHPPSAQGLPRLPEDWRRWTDRPPPASLLENRPADAE